jgi:hypothetical protein
LFGQVHALASCGRGRTYFAAASSRSAVKYKTIRQEESRWRRRCYQGARP